MMEHFDARETLDPVERERELLRRLPGAIASALKSPAWRAQLGEIDAASIATREALAQLPVLRKSALPGLQRGTPPFGGLEAAPTGDLARLFASPGPIFEAEGRKPDGWRCARGLYAAGFRKGDIVVNCFSYHLTPGGFILDSAARALGCPVIPAGPSNTDQIIDAVAHYRASAYCGTPDFLKILLDRAQETGKDVSSLKKACLSGAAFPPSLQAEFKRRNVDAYQIYATAEAGLIAYETVAREGLVVNEDIVVEILRPGTRDPVASGEVGEIAVSILDGGPPLIRFAPGDLTAVLPGASRCGRTNLRVKGWMGRADQTTKVRGQFVRPEQVAEMIKRHPEVSKGRLIIGRQDERDTLIFQVETERASETLKLAIAEALKSITGLNGSVELVKAGSLPNDGKVIADERPTAA